MRNIFSFIEEKEAKLPFVQTVIENIWKKVLGLCSYRSMKHLRDWYRVHLD